MKNSILATTLALLCISTEGFSQYETFQDSKTDLWGVKKDGVVMIPAEYQVIFSSNTPPFSSSPKGDKGMSSRSEHLLDAFKDGRWQRLDKQGNILFQPVFFDNGPDYYVQGLSRFVTNKHKVGFHDVKGNTVVEADYHFAAPFAEPGHETHPLGLDYTLVCNNCYVEGSIQKSYPVSYFMDERDIMDDGKTGCCHNPVKGGEWGVVDKTGRVVVPLEHDNPEDAMSALPLPQ